MNTPATHRVRSDGLSAISRKPRRRHKPNHKSGFKRALRTLLLLIVLTIVLFGATKTFDYFQNRRSIVPVETVPAAKIGTGIDQPPALTGSVVVAPAPSNAVPVSQTDTGSAQAPTSTAKSEVSPVPSDKSVPVGGGLGGGQDQNAGILMLVNRTHPLSASYVPNLVVVRARLSPNITPDEKMMQPEAAQALENLMQKADQDHVTLYCVSGYRSFATQKALYDWRVKADGQATADLYTAHPGQSEHQTGLAMDLTDKSGAQGELVAAFGQTAEGKWLASNAQSFGFVIRYPQGREKITGYNYEPWHIRYVGVTAAKAMKTQGLVLEEYVK